MDEIISRLTQIENSASSVMDEANAKKKVLSDDMAEKTKSWDNTLLADTEKEIEALRKKMQASINEQLAAQKAAADKEIADMQASYDQNHNRYAEELFNRVTAEES